MFEELKMARQVLWNCSWGTAKATVEVGIDMEEAYAIAIDGRPGCL